MDPKKRAVQSWILYDWANSAFAIVVMSAIMPVFYSGVAGNTLPAHLSTAYWGYTQSISLIVIVLIAPILGAIADIAQVKMRFLRFFTYLGVIATLLMFTIGEGNWLWASFLVVIGTISFTSSNIFYDAFLPELVRPEKRDLISSYGYAMGYLGGGLILAISIGIILFHSLLGLTESQASQVSFLLTGIWWFLFSIPLFRHVKEPKKSTSKLSWGKCIKEAFVQVGKTAIRLKNYPELFKFLLAFLFFSDGINTIIKMATIYGKEIGIGDTHLIGALLITQFVGLPCTIWLGKISEKWEAKKVLLITLWVYLGIVILGYGMSTQLEFYLLAILVGVVQGGSQALSRSIFSQMVPPEKNNEFFGFFGLAGKFASIFGPFVFGIVGQWTGASKYGVASLAIFFIVGMILLMLVNVEKGSHEAKQK